jgi:hypothetical protein
MEDFRRTIMKMFKSMKWTTKVACLVSVIVLIASHAIIAQEVRIGGVSISVPKRTKSPKTEETTRKDEPANEQPASDSETTKKEQSTRRASGSSDAWVDIMLEEIAKRKKEVETYDPAERSQFVTLSTPDVFLPAISLRARERFYKQSNSNDARRAALNPAFDSLAAVAASKLPVYKPDATLFAFRNAAAEQMMLGALRNAASVKSFKIGLKEANWLIEKNDFGIPVDRYKHGYIWARDSSDDHAYCHLYTLHVQQSYAGGGTYGQTFAKLSDDEIFGCP